MTGTKTQEEERQQIQRKLFEGELSHTEQKQ